MRTTREIQDYFNDDKNAEPQRDKAGHKFMPANDGNDLDRTLRRKLGRTLGKVKRGPKAKNL